MRESKVIDQNSFASSSVAVHLLRGAIGLVVVVAAFTLIPVVGPVSLLLVPVGGLAWRGCPTCWAMGLAATVTRTRLARSCADGTCRLAPQRPDAGPGEPATLGPARSTRQR